MNSEIIKQIHACDDAFIRTFAKKVPFSENLSRWEDSFLPDKWDHNYFEYSAQPTKEEVEAAYEYQKARGDIFLKIHGSSKLENTFGMEELCIAVMACEGPAKEGIRFNNDIEIRPVPLKDALDIELRHYGKEYGEDFVRRSTSRYFEKIGYKGAYIGNTLAGYCYVFTDGNCTNIDGLLVDESQRRKGVAASLIAGCLGSKTYLHADDGDEPQKLYECLGFVTVEKTYEYFLKVE